MSRLFVVSIIGILSTTEVNAADSLWTKAYGGSNIDVAYAVEETFDGGYIVAGYTRSYGTQGGRNVWLFKTDRQGNVLWNKAIGGNSDDEAAAVKQTPDGGFVIAGYTASYGAGGKDVYVVKTDSAGNEIWNRFYGGSSDEEGYALEALPNGNILVGCATSSFGAGSRDGWLLKLNSFGLPHWTKTYGGFGTDGIRGLALTTDGKYVFTGWTASNGADILGNAWIVKTDTSGTQLFSKHFGGTDADRGLSVCQLTDGGFLLTGYTASSGAGLDDMYLVKTDANGTAKWLKTYGGSGRDYGNAVKQTPDGNYLIAGYTLSFGAGGDDVYIVKTDTAGVLINQRTLGGTASDVAYSIDLTSDGGYIIAGHTLSYGAGVHDAWLIRNVPQIVPVELTSFTYHRSNNTFVLNWATASETNNKGFEIFTVTSGKKEKLGFIQGAGNSISENRYEFVVPEIFRDNTEFILNQIDYSGAEKTYSLTAGKTAMPASLSINGNYPNPFNPTTAIQFSIAGNQLVTLKVYNMQGEEITMLLNEFNAGGTYTVRFDASALPAGIYLCRLTSGPGTAIHKLLLVK